MYLSALLSYYYKNCVEVILFFCFGVFGVFLSNVNLCNPNLSHSSCRILYDRKQAVVFAFVTKFYTNSDQDSNPTLSSLPCASCFPQKYSQIWHSITDGKNGLEYSHEVKAPVVLQSLLQLRRNQTLILSNGYKAAVVSGCAVWGLFTPQSFFFSTEVVWIVQSGSDLDNQRLMQFAG